MKNLLVTLFIVGGLVGGYLYLSKQKVKLTALDGKATTTRRGDLVVPITATGHIQPAAIVKIKSKASGRVVEIPFNEGQMVKQGDLIVQLDPIDEQRRVEQAEADYERARIDVERAQIAVRDTKEAKVPLAQAQLDQARARLALAEIAFNKKVAMREKDERENRVGFSLTQEEFDQAKANRDQAAAEVKAAEAQLKQAIIGVETAEKAVETAEQTRKTAETALKDAQQRLLETKVYAPIDGMILTRHVQVGEMIQSGTTSLTGGTVLMEIADVENIYAVVNVDEADIGLVRELAPISARPGPAETQPADAMKEALENGQPVKLSVEAFRDQEFTGEIERISPQAEQMQAIATVEVRVRITSPNRNLLIGLLNTQVESTFTSQAVRNQVLVSSDCVHKNPKGAGYGVFVPSDGPLREEFRPCKFGVDNGVEVEVIEGLKEGEQVWLQRPKLTEKEEQKAEENE